MASPNIFLSPVLRRILKRRFVSPPPGIEILAGRWEDQPDDDDAPVVERGGEGSGHYGHAGIPGHRGGSLPGEVGQAGEEGQSRIAHPPEFYRQIAEEADARIQQLREAADAKHGFSYDRPNMMGGGGNAKTNAAFRWLQGRLGDGVKVERAKAEPWRDSVSGRVPTGTVITFPTGNQLLVHMKETPSDGIELTHIFALRPGEGIGTRFMDALKDYADLRQEALNVEMIANPLYFAGLGWMQSSRDIWEREAYYRDPQDPKARGSWNGAVYLPPLVSKHQRADDERFFATREMERQSVERGGPGSGHFEHAGIPGHRGGSLPGEAGQAGEGRPGGGTAKPTPRIVVSDRVNSHLFGVPGEKVLPEYLKAAWAKAAQDSVNRFADQTNYYPDDVLVTNDAVLFLEGSTVEDPAHEAGYLEGVILGAHNEDVGSIWMQDVRGTDFMPDSVKWHQGLYHELGHWTANKVIGKAHYEEVVPHVPITYSEPLRRNYDYDSEAVVRSEYIADLFSDYVSFQTGLAPESATGPVFRRLDSKPWTEEDVSNFQAITRVMAEAQEATRKAGGKALRQRAASATLSVLVIYNVAEEAFIMPADEAPEPVEGRVTVLPLVGSAVERGGPGSGHHGHAGIPGHQGGSLPGEGGQAEQAPEEHYGGYKIQHGTLGLAKGKVALVIPGGGNTNWHNTLDEALKQAKVWDAERQESIKLKVIRDAAVETVKAGSATNEDLRVWAGGLKEWQNAVGTDKATGMLRDLGLKAVEAKRLLYKTPSGISSGGYDIYFLEEIYAAYKRQYGPAVERFDISPVLRRLITKGGPGSGHHGHAGIPGHQGGSLPGEAGQAGEEHEGGGSQTSDRVNTSHLSKLGVTASNADVQGLVAALKGIPDNESIPSAERRGTHYYPAEEVESELNASWREFWLAPDGSAFAVGESGHDWAAAKALAEHYYRQHNDEFLPRMTLSMHPSGMAYLTMRAPIRGDIPVDIAEGTPKNNGDFDWSGWGFTQMGTTGPTPTPEEIIALNPTAAYEGLVRRASTGTEETLAAYGFVRVSRGGSKSDAAAGVSWDATLPPTQKQKDALSSVVSSVQANGGSILWETLNQTSKEFGVEGDAKDTDGYSAFWSAIDGDYVAALAKRTKPIPELAMRFLIRRGGPGSGHFGHAGRPGERGGSLPGEAGQAGEESPSSLGGRVHSEAMTAHIGAIRVTSADSDGVLDALHQNRNLYSTKTEQNEWVARGAEVWLAPSGEVFDVERSNGHARVASLALSSHYATRVDDFAPYLTLRPFTDEELMLIANRPPSERALYNHLSIEIPGRGLIDLSMSRPGKEGGLEWMWGLDLPMGQTPMNPDPIDVMKLDPGRMLGELWYPDDRDHDSEVIMAAHGFVRISRGGAAGSKTVGITWDAALSPTKAQQDVLSAAVAPIQANEDAQLVYETVNNTAAHPGAEGIARFEDDYPDFWNAIEGKTRVAQSLAVRSAMPEWALKFLIPRGGPGSGHHGHEGRPGERGGSLPGDASATGEERPQPGEMLHKWELAGLGTRPYRLVDFWTAPDRGLLEANPIAYNAAWAEHPPTTHNTFGSCEYCGTPITNHYVIQSDDKRRFCVGSECVRKTGDAGLVNALKRYEAKERQAESQERYVRQVEEGKVLLETHRAALSALPHPNEGMARSGRTLYDYYRWGIAEQHFGKSGTASGIRNIKKAVGLTSRGGEGSGHYGHAGIPGHQGGSLPGEAGQAGEEVAGTSADYLGDNASKLRRVPLSIEWHHPESEKPGADFQPLLYHGTVLDHVQDIARDGLLPQVGEWVSDAYARKLEAGEQAIPAVYFAGPTSAEYAEADTRITPADDSYAWKAIMAIEAQVGFLMGKDPESVTVDDIYQNGLMIGVSAETMRDKSLNVVQGTIETDETFSRPVSVVGPEDMLVGGEKEVVEYLGPERGDFFTHDKVEPTEYLYGGNLVRWMANWVRRYSDIPKGEYPEDELAGEYAKKWAIQWESELYDHEALLDDFPGEQEDIEEESLARRVDAAVLRALSETPLATLVSRRIFIPQWLIERGGPGSGHFGHEGIPGHRGGSLPGDAEAAGEAHKPGKEVSVGITSQHEGLVPGGQLHIEMEALREELKAIPDVKNVRAYIGMGAWEGGGERTFVLRYEGNGRAKQALAMAGARWGQDSVLLMEPPTADNSHAVTELSFDRKLTKDEMRGINADLVTAGFSGWTWGLSRDRYTPMLRIAAVPDYEPDKDVDAAHPGRVDALTVSLDALGLGYHSSQFQAAMTTIGPKGGTDYQPYIDSLVHRGLTWYRRRYIKKGSEKGAGNGQSTGAGRSDSGGGSGQDAGAGGGGRRMDGPLAGRSAGPAGASDATGRGASDVHSQVGLRAGVTISRVLRLVRRGGPGSGHYGHEGIPGHRGGSLPGDAVAQGEMVSTPEVKREWAERLRLGEMRGPRIAIQRASEARGWWLSPGAEFYEVSMTHDDTADDLLGGRRNAEDAISALGVRPSAGSDRTYSGDVLLQAFGWLRGGQRPRSGGALMFVDAYRYPTTAQEDAVKALYMIIKPSDFEVQDSSGTGKSSRGVGGEAERIFGEMPDLTMVGRGGPGSGHYGHEGIPQHRGGSLPGAGPTKEELQRASRFYDKRKADYHSRFDAMVARHKAIDEKALAHARPDVEGLAGDWAKAVALKLLEGPTYSGNVKAMAADIKRFAAGTLAWLRKEKPSETLRPEELRQAIGTLEHVKAAMEYWIRVDEPERAMESAASFVTFDLQSFVSQSGYQGLLKMIDANGNVDLTHPAVVNMMEAGGVREQAITRILGLTQEYSAERSAYLQAGAEIERGTAEVDAFFERAPQVMADVSPVGMSVAAVTAPKVALDTALGTQETTRLAYHDAIHALTVADQDKTMPQEDVFRIAEACDYALEAYQNAQRDVATLNIVGHDEAKEIVNAALLTADAANVEVLLDASTSMLWTAGQRDAQRLYAREAQTWLTEHADASIFPSTDPMLVTVKNTDSDVDSRASYSNNNINGKAGMDTATYLHELGHWVEDHNEGIHESAVAFLRSRTAGESTQPLRKVTGDWGYDPWELTRKDEFSSAYVGKIYGQSYTATEVVSMGIQRLYQNPSYFQREDPEHFDFTVALLRGLWNKPTP